MNYVGKYDKHECKVELKKVEVADSGNWTCKVEGYGFFTRGDIVKKQLQIEVLDIIRSPGSSTPSSSTPAPSKSSSVVPSTTASPKTKFTERTHVENEGSIPIKVVTECSNLSYNYFQVVYNEN